MTLTEKEKEILRDRDREYFDQAVAEISKEADKI